MPVITLPDGEKGYTYPRKPQPYKPTTTPYVGKIIPPKRGHLPKEIVIREASTYGRKPNANNASGTYWVAPVLPDGSIGAMTTRYVDYTELYG